MLSATEVSGDMQGAHLVKAIKSFCPSAHFVGIGGERMREAGVDVKFFTAHMGTIGLAEGLKYYSSFLKIRSKAERMLREEHPNLIILIDSRDFNINLIGPANKLGIPVIYYVAPPIWAWPDWRMKRMARKVSKIITVFPFELEAYKKTGADVVWVGHPLLDIAWPSMNREEACQKFGLDSFRPIVGLLPGSREHEINKFLPLMLLAAGTLKEKIREIQYLLPIASSSFEKRITEIVEKSGLRVKIIKDSIYDVMNIATLLITASGTATLEAACLGTPMVIIYKAHITSYLLAQVLLNVSHVGLPNILADKRIVPELLHFKATKENIVRVVLDLLTNPDKLNRMRGELGKVVKKLGSPGAIERAAQVVLKIATESGNSN